MQNDGPGVQASLLFVAAALTGPSSGDWLDDVPVTHEQTAAYLAPSWMPPGATPSLSGGGYLPYEVQGGAGAMSALTFTLGFTPGPHTVVVRYFAAATASSRGYPVRYWQLGYVLAPAREWASFGGLAVTVELPDGWHVASEPALQRVGSQLQGSFSSVPADSLAITAQAPAPFWSPPWSCVAPLAAGLATVVLGGFALGRLFGRRRWGCVGALLGSVALGLVWSVITCLALTYFPPVPAGQEDWNYCENNNILAAVAFLPVWIAGVLFGLVGVWRGSHRARAERDGRRARADGTTA